MNSEMIQVLVLAAIALFLVLRLRNVLGTRDGFEKTPGTASSRRELPRNADAARAADEASADDDIPEDVQRDGPIYKALLEMRMAEPGFSVSKFMNGAKQAYEMVVVGFEEGDLDGLQGLLAEDVMDGFRSARAQRARDDLTVEARFGGVRDIALTDAQFDAAARTAEITLRFVGEIASVTRDANGRIVEGDPMAMRRQTDAFTFERRMGSDDPNWILVSTGG
ncbi:MAG: Tim44/TimA family putative adaptor protein [Pseudomonadota bacterium]